MKEKKKIAIGCDSFKELRSNKEAYYIDKSLFIKDIIDCCSVAVLITRPKGFGKTLNMSMLDSYLNIDYDSKELFKGLKIMETGEKYVEYLNNCPVIYVTFNSINGCQDYEKMLQEFRNIFSDLYSKFNYLLESDKLAIWDKDRITKIINKESNESELITALRDLCRYLKEYYGKYVYLLIDEYDVPLQCGYLNGYYKDALSFINGMYAIAFKGNDSLKTAVVTGVSRITKASTYSGPNNFDVYTMLRSNEFSDDFGFTEEEVNKALIYFGLDKYKDEVKEYYGGYTIDDTTDIYNPRSVLKYLNERKLGTYYDNTDSNNIINRIVEKDTYLWIKEDLQKLLNDEAIEVKVDGEVSIDKIDINITSIWSFLFGSGYLKVVEAVKEIFKIYKVKIPNQEIMLIFNKTVKDWFNDKLKVSNLHQMLQYLVKLEIDEFTRMFQERITYILSYFDVPKDNDNKAAEIIYHVFTLGILAYMKDDYYIYFNRESGFGRYDIEMEAKDTHKPSFILEFKGKKKPKPVVKVISKQIEERKYTTNLEEKGITNIHKLVFVLDGREVVVKEIA